MPLENGVPLASATPGAIKATPLARPTAVAARPPMSDRAPATPASRTNWRRLTDRGESDIEGESPPFRMRSQSTGWQVPERCFVASPVVTYASCLPESHDATTHRTEGQDGRSMRCTGYR